jgi:hypothetical protein
MTKHTNIWRIGKVTITRIVEFEVSGQPPSLILANVEPEHVKRFDWLRPHYADDDGQLAFSVHAYVIESEERRIIVDTCAGNDKQRSLPHFDQLEGPFLDCGLFPYRPGHRHRRPRYYRRRLSATETRNSIAQFQQRPSRSWGCYAGRCCGRRVDFCSRS